MHFQQLVAELQVVLLSPSAFLSKNLSLLRLTWHCGQSFRNSTTSFSDIPVLVELTLTKGKTFVPFQTYQLIELVSAIMSSNCSSSMKLIQYSLVVPL